MTPVASPVDPSGAVAEPLGAAPVDGATSNDEAALGVLPESVRKVSDSPGTVPGNGRSTVPIPRAVNIDVAGTAKGETGAWAYIITDPGTGTSIYDKAGRVTGATANVARYHGMIAALETAADGLKATDVTVRITSQSTVRTVTGDNIAFGEVLRTLIGRLDLLRDAFTSLRYVHIGTDVNGAADHLAAGALTAVPAPKLRSASYGTNSRTRDRGAVQTATKATTHLRNSWTGTSPVERTARLACQLGVAGATVAETIQRLNARANASLRNEWNPRDTVDTIIRQCEVQHIPWARGFGSRPVPKPGPRPRPQPLEGTDRKPVRSP